MNPLTHSIEISSEHVSDEVELEGIAYVHHRANVLVEQQQDSGGGGLGEGGIVEGGLERVSREWVRSGWVRRG